MRTAQCRARGPSASRSSVAPTGIRSVTSWTEASRCLLDAKGAAKGPPAVVRTRTTARASQKPSPALVKDGRAANEEGASDERRSSNARATTSSPDRDASDEGALAEEQKEAAVTGLLEAAGFEGGKAEEPEVRKAAEAVIATWEDLPNEDSEFYDWKYGSRIHYVQRGTSGPPLLLVHGFGVGAYQFEDNIAELSKTHRVWALDLLGQGASWPHESAMSEEADGPLQYSLDTWTDQLTHFVRNIMQCQEGVYIAGNSLGGLLAVSLAYTHPELVRGLMLLNAAPFWSIAPRADSPLARLWPYDGKVPPPAPLAAFIKRYWFSNLSNPATIREVLGLVYADKANLDESLVNRIAASAAHPRALDAFVSMVFSPRGAAAFDEMAASLSVPICLVYGREDPWVVPVWGQRLKRRIPQLEYYELSPAGHCPHHEVPHTVNTVIQRWVSAKEDGRDHDLLEVGSTMTVDEAEGRQIDITHTAGLPRNVFERVDYAFWRARKGMGRALGMQENC